MDKLKEEINKRKAKLNTTSTGWVKKGEIIKQQTEQYLLEKQKAEEQAKEKLQKQLAEIEVQYKQKPEPSKSSEKLAPAIDSSKKQEEGKSTEPTPVTINLSKKEVINRLREYKQPITLFGEEDLARYKRLCKYEQENADETKLKDEHNQFQKDLQMNEEEFKKLEGAHLEEGQGKEDELPDVKPVQELLTKATGKQTNYKKFESLLKSTFTASEKCMFILKWCKAMLRAWKNELAPLLKEESATQTQEDMQKIGVFRQCRRYIKPLFRLLEKNDINIEILDGLNLITSYCMLGDFQRAYEKYLELAIGNAPWPMGVTMVGIHERSGRTRIFTSQVAHILNDETQRKYLQSIKRLFSVAQRAAGDKSVKIE